MHICSCSPSTSCCTAWLTHEAVPKLHRVRCRTLLLRCLLPRSCLTRQLISWAMTCSRYGPPTGWESHSALWLLDLAVIHWHAFNLQSFQSLGLVASLVNECIMPVRVQTVDGHVHML